MADLSEVKKEIISLINLHPDGIAADRFNREYEQMVGRSIPYGDFLYMSLIAFFEEEFKENMKVSKVGLQMMLYPIANEKSAHIIKMLEEQKTNRRPRHAPRNSSHSNSNSQASPRSPASTSQRSPTMPRLVEYRPFRNMNNGARQNEQKIAKERLLQSQEQYIKRQEQITGCVRRPCAPERLANRTEKRQNGSRTSSDARSSIRSKVQQLSIKIQAKKESASSSWNASQSSNQPSSPPTNPQSKAPVEKLEMNTSAENLWDDELDNLEPPVKSKANSNSSIYGVSEDGSIPDSSRENTSHPLLSVYSDEEETEIADIKSLISEIRVGDVIPVQMSEINSPLKFWVHILQEKYGKQFDALFDDMQKFYNMNRNLEELKVTDPDEPNSYFAVNYKGYWHRAEIMDLQMGESFRVSFIDEGSRDIINISQMRKLPKQFWKVPKAALCCALGNIKPKGKEFTVESTDTLMDLLDGKTFARILQIDTTKSKAIVEITSSEKLCVNEEMIRLGYAIAKKARANA